MGLSTYINSMRLTALILDDEAQSRSALRAKLELFCLEVTDIREASTVDEAWDLLIEVQPDIVFLDIHLGGEVGFALLDRINVDEPQWQGSVIFVTAHEAYALRAIKFSALDYLLKPVDPEELVKAVRKAELNSEGNQGSLSVLQSNLASENKKMVISSSDGLYILSVNEIMHCESTSNYTTFYLWGGKKYIASKTLKEYENLLAPMGFKRIHKSHLVNMAYVTRYVTADGGYLLLKDESTVPVANRKKESLVTFLKGL